MEILEIILRYLQVFLNWPFIFIVIIFLFRKQISEFLMRLTKGKLANFFTFEAPPLKQEKALKEDKIKNPKDRAIEFTRINTEKAFEEYVKTYNAYFFERTFNIIFGSQIDLLEYLANKENKNEKWVNLFTFYYNFMMKTVPPRVTFDQYLGFLESCKFIKIMIKDNEKIVEISPYGSDFLFYLKSQYPIGYKYKLF